MVTTRSNARINTRTQKRGALNVLKDKLCPWERHKAKLHAQIADLKSNLVSHKKQERERIWSYVRNYAQQINAQQIQKNTFWLRRRWQSKCKDAGPLDYESCIKFLKRNEEHSEIKDVYVVMKSENGEHVKFFPLHMLSELKEKTNLLNS